MGRRSRTKIAALVAPALALTGCSGVLGIEPKEVDACAWLARQSGETAGAVDLVVLVDRTRSMSSREDQRTFDWYAQVFGGTPRGKDHELAFQRRALPTPANLRIGGFDGSGRVEWRDPIVLPRLDGGERYSRQFAVRTSECLREELGEAAARPSRVPGTDVLGAMIDGARSASGGARRREMVVLTDGLQTTGCADLRETAMRDYALIGRITANCAAQGGLPALKGWRVTLSGIGNPAEGWPQPRGGRLGWLTSLWSALCVSATVEERACALDTRTAATDEKVTAEEGAGEPVIRFPRTERPTDPRREVTFPGRVLFDTGRWELRESGRREIGRLVDEIQAAEPEWIKVFGHTDSRGTEAANQELSRKRAETVARELRDAGLGRVDAEGRGESTPACSESGLTGAALAAAQECNRRVTVQYKVRG